jgi:hypothetical protein
MKGPLVQGMREVNQVVGKKYPDSRQYNIVSTIQEACGPGQGNNFDDLR